MEDPGSIADRSRTRQRALIVERGFEMERVERTLLATAYETVWSPGHAARDRSHAARCVGSELVRSGGRLESAPRLGRAGGSGSFVAMGG